ncbi:MAG: TIGR04211 family SH3 domain-containing protein [Chromatiaceae bacterium]|nr:TIGR04211 family SH3 domain-containing protein [Chromatiaceae bacterium]
MTRLLLLLLCLCGIGQSLAESRYVTDQSQIMLRKGESTRHKIVRSLPSGMAVEELSTNETTGYSRVRTEDGTTGYVLTHQLQDEPVARDRLAAMEARLAELQQAPDQLAVKLTEIQSAYDKLQIDHDALEGEKERLEQELASIKHASANVVRITQERSELRKQVADLARHAADLQQENRDIKNETTQRWFLIGAGVVTGGVLIGLILPHLRFRRRKSSWGSL